jgi:tetratricopeptide (TPR) repeat protein
MSIQSPKSEGRSPKAICSRMLRASFLTPHASRFTLFAVALLVAFHLPASPASPPAPPPTAFQSACDLYSAGAFDRSAEAFRELARTQPSAGALHNLGNAEWKRGQTGEAILAWERACWLDPFHAGARANLRFVRKAVQLGAPDLAWDEICSTWLPVNVWPWLAGGSLWFAVALVMLPGIFRWRRADWHQAAAAAGFAVFLLTLPALVGVQTRSKLGVIREADTLLRLTPTREAQVLTKLPAGELARAEQERGDYVLVRASGDAVGWVRRAEFGLISGR